MSTVVHTLVKQFRQWGVHHVFGVPGKAVVPIILECGNQNVEYVLSRHECGAGYAAAGYAMLKGTMGVAISTSGPGGTNMLTAAGQAKAYHLPVLFITGHASTRDTGKPLGQDSTFLGTDLVKMFEPVTLFSARIERPEQLMLYLSHAVDRAYTGIRGPVHLAISYDVFTEPATSFELPLPDHKYPFISSRLSEAKAMLDEAKRPVLMIGKGVHISQAYEQVQQLAEYWSIPVITTPGGKGAFPTNHRLHLGPYGLGGCQEAAEYLKAGTDVMVVVGSKLSDMSTPGFTDAMMPERLIHFDIDSTFIRKSLPSPTLFVHGDAAANLNALLSLAAQDGPPIEIVAAKAHDHDKEIAAAIECIKTEETNNYSESAPITAVEAMDVIGTILPEDSIVFGDDGSHSYHAIRSLNIKKAGFFRFDDVFAAMGHAIGFSIGAQIAAPSKRIVCITGDGCMFMHGTEISTAVNQKAPVIFIVLNNGQLDMVRKGMKQYTGREDGTLYETPMKAADFAASMGALAYTCSTKSEFCATLIKALDINKTQVIELLVDREEIPPTLARG